MNHTGRGNNSTNYFLQVFGSLLNGDGKVDFDHGPRIFTTCTGQIIHIVWTSIFNEYPTSIWQSIFVDLFPHCESVLQMSCFQPLSALRPAIANKAAQRSDKEKLQVRFTILCCRSSIAQCCTPNYYPSIFLISITMMKYRFRFS